MSTGRRRLEQIDRLLWWHGVTKERPGSQPSTAPKGKLAKRYAWKHAWEHLRSAWTLLRETR